MIIDSCMCGSVISPDERIKHNNPISRLYEVEAVGRFPCQIQFFLLK